MTLSLPALGVALVVAMAAPGLARAQGAEVAFGGLKADTSLPVEVTADVLSVNQTDGTAIFSGNVLVIQGEMRLSADRLEVIYGNAERSRIERLHASGEVTLVSGRPTLHYLSQTLNRGKTSGRTMNISSAKRWLTPSCCHRRQRFITKSKRNGSCRSISLSTSRCTAVRNPFLATTPVCINTLMAGSG